jgi:hypothetical protein
MGMTKRALPLVLVLSCLSEPIRDSENRVGVDYDGVRLIGGDSLAVASSSSSCDILRECCEGQAECIDYVDRLSEADCTDLLEGKASECLEGGNGGGGDDGCCEPDDPCGWEDDGVCDCPGEFWDFADCEGAEGEAEAEAEAEGEDCCSPEDPCEWANDGWCDCEEQAWDESDCFGIPPDVEVADAGVPADF